MRQIKIQNLIFGLVECGEIFVFVKYNDNQTVRFVKVDLTWSIFGQTSELVPRQLDLIKLG